MMKNSNVFVVIPAYNEERSLAEVISDARRYFSNIVVVDDGSHDQTSAIAKKAGAYIVRHPVNLGQGAALQTGIEFSLRRDAEYIVTFDADGQHSAADANAMVEGIAGTDIQVALGSRFIGKTVGMSWLRGFLLKLAVAWLNISSGQKFTDTHNGLRVLKAAAARKLKITSDGMAHASEIITFLCREKIPFKEFPVTITYTSYSYGKGQKLVDLLNTLLTIIFDKLVK